MSGEPESQSLVFSKRCTLWASPANAGALELANEITAAFNGLTISTTDARPANATHMLLYLNEDSFVSDERLAEQVKQAREDRLKIVMAHENDLDLGGCPFSKFFETTPQERLSRSDGYPEPPLPPALSFQRCRSSSPADSTYKDLANSCFPGRHRKARAPSLPQLALRAYSGNRSMCLCDEGLSLFAGVACASGKKPRRDPRSVACGTAFRQHRRARQPRGARLW